MKTIMIIEDHHTLANLYSRVLDQAGYSVVSVDGGDAALAFLRENTPDLVLLDIMMEPMDGWEVLTRIREQNNLRNLPVIIITAKPPSPEVVKRYSSLIDGYVMKPLGSIALKALVENFFEDQTLLDDAEGYLTRKNIPPDIIREYRILASHKKLNESLLAVQERIGIDRDPVLSAELSRYDTLRRELFT